MSEERARELEHIVRNTNLKDEVRRNALEQLGKHGDDAAASLRRIAEDTSIKDEFRHGAINKLGRR